MCDNAILLPLQKDVLVGAHEVCAAHNFDCHYFTLTMMHYPINLHSFGCALQYVIAIIRAVGRDHDDTKWLRQASTVTK